MGWLSTLGAIGGAIAAPFTGGSSLLLPSIIGAAGTIGGGLLAKKATGNAGQLPPYQNPLNTPQGQAATGQQTDITNMLLNTGKGYTGVAQPSLEAVQNYWLPILSGDVTATGQFLAPDISKVSTQYDTARRNIANFVPSGGGRENALGQSYYQQASDVGQLIAGARPKAAAALLGLGGTAGTLGSYAESEASRSNQALIDSILRGGGLDVTARGQDVTQRGQTLNAGASIGNTIGQLLSTLMPQILGRGGSSAAAVPGTPNDFLRNYPQVSSAVPRIF